MMKMPPNSLLTADGRPSKALLDFAKLNGLEFIDAITAAELSQLMQENWLRGSVPRFKLGTEPPSSENLGLLRTLGMVDGLTLPTAFHKHLEALVLGSLAPSVRRRIAWFIKEANRCTIVGQYVTLYLLGSARPLYPEKENAEVLFNPTLDTLEFKPDWQPPTILPTTEAQMMQMVFNQSDLPFGWESVLIDAPMQPTGVEGKTRLANTADTVKELLKLVQNLSSKLLVLSGQPHCQRQLINVRTELAKSGREFEVDVIGHPLLETVSLQVLRDEVARLLFELLKLQLEIAA